MQRLVFATTCALSLLASGLTGLASRPAQANPFPDGNPIEGRALHGEQCMSCHRSMFNDADGSTIYSADFRRIETAIHLAQRVQTCATRTDAPWFEEEVRSVSRYLNDTYYRFSR